MNAFVPYVALKEAAHGMVCLSESHRGVHFRDVICARRYSLFRHTYRMVVKSVYSTFEQLTQQRYTMSIMQSRVLGIVRV